MSPSPSAPRSEVSEERSPREGPIGVFDSGVGGLSVMREIVKKLPHEDIIYFADTAHCPYGPRSLEEIRGLTQAILSFLLAQGCKIIVVACNTASAAALYHLRERFEVPIVGMEPAVKPAAQETETKVVGVIATQATFHGELFASLVQRFASHVTVLEGVCPGLVEQVEAGKLDDPQTEAILRHCLEPMLEKGIDALTLGCTHYPFLIPTIKKIVGPQVKIIDPSPAVARQTKRVLEREGLLNHTHRRGRYTFYTTGHPETFAALQKRLIDLPGETKGVHWSQDNSIITL
ncbi:MAG TPA: glutamate racemase [Chloroflexi bacterium]|nr:glutamate racemase [Chloroflexota bacterium]